MVIIKLAFAILLILAGLGFFNRLSDLFKPVLSLYIFISIVCFYLLFREAYIVYYSGVEIMKGDDSYELCVSEYWDGILALVALVYLLPFLLIVKKIKQYSFLVVLLVCLSVLPDIGQEFVWDLILVEKKV